MNATDEAEFRDFMATRWPALVRTAYLLTCDRHHAEDLAQTTLEKAAVSWQRVRRSDDIDAYVRRMLVNAHLARFRRRRVAEVLSAQMPEAVVSDSAHSVVQRDELMAALAGLPKKQRAVIVLRYWEDLTESQAAAALGCSIGTVRSQAHRALQKLRANPLLAATAAEQAPLDDLHRSKGRTA